MQALAIEARLEVWLQKLVTGLEQVTKNAETKFLEQREIVHNLNHVKVYYRRIIKVNINMKKYILKKNTKKHGIVI